MDIKISPGRLSGTVDAVASKSHTHRLLICAALSDRETEICVLQRSRDIDATAAALSALGADISYEAGCFKVLPIRGRRGSAEIDCAESGSTLRFLLPVAAVLSEETLFTGSGRLPDRPIGELLSAMEENGAVFSGGRLPLTVRGRLRPGGFVLPGNVSSQYVSGLLMALPLLRGDSHIALTTGLQSSAYVDMTLSCLRDFGVSAKKTEKGFFVPGFQKYTSPGKTAAEGDWSNAAFFLAAGALGEPVTVGGLDMGSRQADRAIIDVLRRFGAEVSLCGDSATAGFGALRGCDIDLSEIPDLLPVLSVVAAFSEGETRFFNAQRLRMKESDRLAACASMLKGLGGDVLGRSDGLAVRGRPLKGGTVPSFGDHRMVMSAAIAALFSGGDTVIKGAVAAEKSYPGFFEDFRKLGGRAAVCTVTE